MKQVICNKPRAQSWKYTCQVCNVGIQVKEDIRTCAFLIIVDLEQDPHFPQIMYTAVKDSSSVPEVCDQT